MHALTSKNRRCIFLSVWHSYQLHHPAFFLLYIGLPGFTQSFTTNPPIMSEPRLFRVGKYDSRYWKHCKTGSAYSLILPCLFTLVTLPPFFCLCESAWIHHRWQCIVIKRWQFLTTIRYMNVHGTICRHAEFVLKSSLYKKNKVYHAYTDVELRKFNGEMQSQRPWVIHRRR